MHRACRGVRIDPRITLHVASWKSPVVSRCITSGPCRWGGKVLSGNRRILLSRSATICALRLQRTREHPVVNFRELMCATVCDCPQPAGNRRFGSGRCGSTLPKRGQEVGPKESVSREKIMNRVILCVLFALLTAGANTSAVAARYQNCHRVLRHRHWHRVCR